MKLYIDPCQEYPLHELDITDWLAKEKGFNTQLTGGIDIIRETVDAYLIAVDDERIEGYKTFRYWLPNKHCKIVERTEPKKEEPKKERDARAKAARESRDKNTIWFTRKCA